MKFCWFTCIQTIHTYNAKLVYVFIVYKRTLLINKYINGTMAPAEYKKGDLNEDICCGLFNLWSEWVEPVLGFKVTYSCEGNSCYSLYYFSFIFYCIVKNHPHERTCFGYENFVNWEVVEEQEIAKVEWFSPSTLSLSTICFQWPFNTFTDFRGALKTGSSRPLKAQPPPLWLLRKYFAVLQLLNTIVTAFLEFSSFNVLNRLCTYIQFILNNLTGGWSNKASFLNACVSCSTGLGSF